MTGSGFAILLLSVAVVIITTTNAAIGGATDIAIVILSQQNAYHETRAQQLRQSLLNQATLLNFTEPTVLLSHETWPQMIGSWTIFPIIPLLVQEYKDSKSAVFFCEDDLTINLSWLLKKLNETDLKKELFLGRALRDREATIIHHFAFHEDPSSFSYPDFASGFLISMPLMKKLSEKLEKSPLRIDFTIDAQHELALYIWNGGDGVQLTDAGFFCGYAERSGNCATQRLRKSPNCGNTVKDDEVFFAVKTCQKFHNDRLPVLKQTWGQHARRIEYFSDVDDPSIPTTNLGVPNTERGHCAKFMAILETVHKNLNVSNYKWLVVVDDDTLLSISRLKKLLACYSPFDNVALGERYGYGAVAGHGYNYITLGGGMALSRAALLALIESGDCQCAADDSPDDMTFGMCLKHHNIPVTHSPLFHQARPVDYAEGYLSNQESVSFHRHWMIDPIDTYHQWLEGFDPSEKDQSHKDRSNKHIEL